MSRSPSFSFFFFLSLLSSFRLVPSFGRDTIRRISSNASELKQPTAHTYENLLQVSSSSGLQFSVILTSQVSVLFLSLMACYRSLTILQFCLCYSPARIGTRWRNYACIPTIPSHSSTQKRSELAQAFGLSPTRPARRSTRKNSNAKLQQDTDATAGTPGLVNRPAQSIFRLGRKCITPELSSITC